MDTSLSLSVQREQLHAKYKEYKEMQQLRLSMYFNSVDNASTSMVMPNKRIPGRASADNSTVTPASKPTSAILQVTQESNTERGKFDKRKSSVPQKKIVEKHVRGTVQKDTEKGNDVQTLAETTKTVKSQRKRKKSGKESVLLPSAKRKKQKDIEKKASALRNAQHGHTSKIEDIMHSEEDFSNYDERQDLSRINKREEIENWAKPYQNAVQDSMDILTTPLLFGRKFKDRFVNEIIETGTRENVLPKTVIKNVLDKYNKRASDIIVKQEVDKQIRHLLYTRDKDYESKDTDTKDYWAGIINNLNFSPPPECPVGLNAAQDQYLEYTQLVENISKSQREREKNIEVLTEVNKLSEVTQEARKTVQKGDFSLGRKERRDVQNTVNKLSKDVREKISKIAV